MTLVIPRGQTAQPGPRSGPAGTLRQPGLGSAAGRPRPRGGPIQEKPDGNRGPSGFRVTSRFEQSIQPQSVTGAAGRHQGGRSVTGGG